MRELTVGIPVYNAMPFLRESMESILSQTMNDFEILAVNDGSTDDSLEYLESIRDPRVRIVSQRNHGLTVTLNRMLHETQTPWLVRMDADDVASQQRLEIVLDSIKRKPDAGMFYSRARHYQHPKAISMVRSSEGNAEELRQIARQGYLLSICHSSAVLNTKKTLDAGGYRFNLHIEDLDLWWRMALAYDIEFIPETTVEYRLNNMSICSKNLRNLQRNTLYVQYLLLSHLRGAKPLTLDAVSEVLETLVDDRYFKYREQMWKAAISLSKGEHASAALHMGRALFNAPSRFLIRGAYSFKKTQQVRIGESPAKFHKLEKQLWASQTGSLVMAASAAR